MARRRASPARVPRRHDLRARIERGAFSHSLGQEQTDNYWAKPRRDSAAPLLRYSVHGPDGWEMPSFFRPALRRLKRVQFARCCLDGDEVRPCPQTSLCQVNSLHYLLMAIAMFKHEWKSGRGFLNQLLNI